MPMPYDFLCDRATGRIPVLPLAGEELHDTYNLTIADDVVLSYMRRRWSPGYHWAIGSIVPIDGRYINDMFAAGIFRTGTKRPLERWWEPEIATLPEDIVCPV